MKRLIIVELRRLLARRLFKVLSILVVAGFVFGGTMAFIASDDSPQKVAQAKARYEAVIDDCLETSTRAICEENNWLQDPRFVYRDFNWMLMGLGMPLAMLGWLLGASSVGAEWNNRTMTTTLTWESRRARVLSAKIITTAVIVFGWVFLLQVIFAALMYPAAEFEGSTAGLDAAFWVDLSQTIMRVAAVAALAGVLGASLATIGRHTAAAFGVGFAYLAVVEGLIRRFKPGWVDWLVGDNAALVMIGSDEVNHLGHSQLAALVLLVAYAAALFMISLSVFSRRDLA